jgi:transposase
MQVEVPMQVIYRRCCGIDVHKEMIVACVLIWTAQGIEKEIQKFGTMLQELYRLRDWLKAKGCEAVAMESTGVYWKPIWNVLEGEMELLLVNAQHIKAVPGRKTDIKDAEWIADLLQHGLLRPSFVPERPQRELRDLTRYRSSLVAERSRLVNRVHKVLEDANIKLASVAKDIMGKSGRAILEALLSGEENPEVLADLARGRMRKKRQQLVQAVQGTLSQHHRFLLRSQLDHIDFLDRQLSALDQEAAHRLGGPVGEPEPAEEERDDDADPEPEPTQRPRSPQEADEESGGDQPQESLCEQGLQERPLSSAQAIVLLDAIPGINVRIAQVLVAEIGTNVDRFPDAEHLCSWAGLCPAAKISAGKRLGSKTGKGNRWLRQALSEAAQAAARTKRSVLGAYYRQQSQRMGRKKALVALAHRILILVYHLLKEKQPYRELGPGHLEEKALESSKRWAVRRLERLGYQVTLQSAEVA